MFFFSQRYFPGLFCPAAYLILITFYLFIFLEQLFSLVHTVSFPTQSTKKKKIPNKKQTNQKKKKKKKKKTNFKYLFTVHNH